MKRNDKRRTNIFDYFNKIMEDVFKEVDDIYGNPDKVKGNWNTLSNIHHKSYGFRW